MLRLASSRQDDSRGGGRIGLGISQLTDQYKTLENKNLLGDTSCIPSEDHW